MPIDSEDDAPRNIQRCPAVLHEKNCYLNYLTPDEERIIRQWRWGAANRLRADFSRLPFYANRAAACKAKTGSEMHYWLDLQGSFITQERPDPPEDYVPEPLSPQEIEDLLDDAMGVISKHRQPPGVPGINIRPKHPPDTAT